MGTSKAAIAGNVGSGGLDLEPLVLEPPAPNWLNMQVHKHPWVYAVLGIEPEAFSILASILPAGSYPQPMSRV